MRKQISFVGTAVVAWGVVVGPVAASQVASPAVPTTSLISVSSGGHVGNNITGRMARPEVNADGSVVVFDSIANNLVRHDKNHSDDVFVRDRNTGKTTRVSVSSSGVEGNNDSSRPDVSADGRYVVYDSNATNLVDAPDQNGVLDVFRYDRVSGTTTLVSVALDGDTGNASSFEPAISANGRFVAFTSDSTDLTNRPASGARDIFVRDMQTGKTTIVSIAQDGTPAGGGANSPTISANGRFVTFDSFASDVVAGDTNDSFDVFLRDRKLRQTTRVSVDSAGAEGLGGSYEGTISDNGRRIAFVSDATNLVPDDTNGFRDVFVHDRRDATTIRVSVGADGVQSDGQSDGPGVRGGTTFGPSLSADGRYVVFDSIATNLVADDTNTCSFGGGGGSFPEPGQCPDIFLHDLTEQTTTRMSVATDGGEADDASTDPAISGDGLAVVFFTTAAFSAQDTNMCPPFFFGHAGQCPDIYLHTR